MSVAARPGDAVGAIDTPALVIDLDALERNVATMAAFARSHGLRLRPHAKTHKSVDIVRRQLAAGASGVCCAKIGEAEVLADGGITGILITSPVAAPRAIERLAAFASTAEGLMTVIDHPAVAGRLNVALETSLDVVIDIDPGIARAGVASPEAAVALARPPRRGRSARRAGNRFFRLHRR